jgi:maleate isomerase
MMREHLLSVGFDVPAMASFELLSDTDMASVTHDALEDAAADFDRNDVDGVFVSCTALRAVGAVERIERRLGKPVVTSNQAFLWHALRLAGVDDRLSGFGRLWERRLA